jgi:hypothetical protein
MLKKIIQYFSVLGVLIFVNTSFAQFRVLSDLDDIEKNKTVTEKKVEFPNSPPQEKDLLPFSPSSNSQAIKFFMDQKNISFDQGVVRYVLVIKSTEGAEQTIFAGIDCNQFTKITYARLNNNTWAEVQGAKWQPIGSVGYNNYAGYLYKKILCDGSAVNNDLREVIKRLRSDN